MVMVFLLILLFPLSAQGITADELRELSDIWETNQRERAGRIETKDLNKLIPKKPGKKTPPVEPEGAEKNQADTVKKTPPVIARKKARRRLPDQAKSKKSEQEAESALFPGRLPPRMIEQNAKGKYFPPPRQGGFDAVTDAVSPGTTRRFGISIGTWIKGELKRPASNAEPGLIEIYTTEEVGGKLRTLPSGTTLFAGKAYNTGTKKLDLLVEKGITPQGFEFEVQGLVFDLHKSAGLIGNITTDSEMIVERSTARGLIAAGEKVVENIAGSTIIGAAGSAAAESLFSDSADAVHETKKLKQTIRSVPQALLIRVEKTF
ncbi:MAG: hypothetical protein ACE5FY_04120 [Nitrospiria bacterium]